MTRLSRLIAVFAVALLVILGGVWLTIAHKNSRALEQSSSSSAQIGGPFTLIDTSGKTVTDQRYRGKWLLIYFGYTFCPDACPTALNEMGVALQKLGDESGKLQPLFITVDPKRDTVEVMRDYLKSFDPRIVGLTGSQEQTEVTSKGVVVTETAEEADIVKVIHAHAQELNGFVDEGMPAMMRDMMQ